MKGCNPETNLGGQGYFHAIGKSSTSKCKLSDLLLLALKFTKFLMSFLESRVSFSSNFTSLFSVMRHNSSAIFHLNLCMFFGQKNPIKVEIFRLSTARMKINQIPYIIFQVTSQISFKFCNTLHCHDT